MQETEILARFPGPVWLYPSRLRVVGIMLLSVSGVIVLSLYISGISDAVHPQSAYQRIISWGSIVVLVPVAVGCLIPLLFPKTICLILDADGFEIRRFAKSERVRWRDVRGFDIHTIWLPRSSNLEQVAFRTAKSGGTLPNNYGLGLQDLLRLMKAWHERAVSRKAA